MDIDALSVTVFIRRGLRIDATPNALNMHRLPEGNLNSA